MIRRFGPVCAAALVCLAPGAAMAAGPTFADGLAALGRADYPAALRIIGPQAAAGEDKAQFVLGQMYRQGRGLRQDNAQALAWLRKAADQGNPGAAFTLGSMVLEGRGVHADETGGQVVGCVGPGRVRQRPGRARPAVCAGARRAARSDPCSCLAHQGRRAGRRRGPVRAPASSIATAPRRAHDAARTLSRADGPRLGPGRWRETGGYRTMAQEDRLRAEGAGTVPAGERSKHSTGTRDAPAPTNRRRRRGPATGGRPAAPVRRAAGAHRRRGRARRPGSAPPCRALPGRPAGPGAGGRGPAQPVLAAAWFRRAADQGDAGAAAALAALQKPHVYAANGRAS